MKVTKIFPIFTTLFLEIATFSFCSCEGFLNGSSLKEELDSSIEYAREEQHLSILRFAPLYTDSGVYEKTPIVITFNKPVNKTTFDYQIVSSSGINLKEFYKSPVFTENNSKVIIYPETDMYISSLFKGSSELIIDFTVSENTMASDGTHFDRNSKTVSYKLNDKYEEEAPVITNLKFARTENNLKEQDYLPIDEYGIYENASSLWIDCTGYDTGSGIKTLLIKEVLKNNVKGEVKNSLAYTDSNGYYTGNFVSLDTDLGYAQTGFEYKFNSFYDGLVELTFKLIDNCNNESEEKTIKVYKDTTFSCTNWTFGNGDRYLTSTDGVTTWTTEILDLDETNFCFKNLVADEYYVNKSTPSSEFQINVEYGYDSENLLYNCKADKDGFNLGTVDRSKDIYIKATIYDKAGNYRSVTEILPKKISSVRFDKTDSNERYYCFFDKNTNKTYSYNYYILIKQDSELKYTIHPVPENGQFQAPDNFDQAHTSVYLYTETRTSHIEKNYLIKTLSGPFDVTSENFPTEGNASDLNMPDFNYSYKSNGVGSHTTNIELLLDCDKINEKNYDYVYARFYADSMRGACNEIIEYKNSNIVYDIETVANTGLKIDNYGQAAIKISMIGVKDGQKYTKSISIPKKTFKSNIIGSILRPKNYGRKLLYDTEVNCSEFKVDSNNKIKATIYYTLLDAGIDEFWILKDDSYSNISILRDINFLSKEETKKLNHFDCYADYDANSDAEFEIDMPLLVEGKYVLFINFVDNSDYEYCDVLGIYSNFDSGYDPSISIKDDEYNLSYVINHTNIYGKASYKLFWTLEYFDNNKWNKIVDEESFSLSGSTDKFNNYFLRFAALESTGNYENSSYYNYYFSNIKYAFADNTEEQCSGSLIPVYGGYSVLSKKPALLQTYYASKNFGTSAGNWEKYCLSSEKVNPKVLEPFETYEPDMNEIPSGSYYTVIAYFTDGSSAISDVNYKN